jgi:indolepyruvate ferredoxin oxidoreductase
MPQRPADVARVPYFCSGCPHNTSTKVPEGMRDGRHRLPLRMASGWTADHQDLHPHGRRGRANWVGASPFTDMPHVFQNLGDGTYYHSGLSGDPRTRSPTNTNITYKILYNDAVAMTGGQPHDGNVRSRRSASRSMPRA